MNTHAETPQVENENSKDHKQFKSQTALHTCMNTQHSSWPKYFENRLERRASLQAVVGCFEQMGLQSGIKCSGWLNVPNFTRQVIPERRGSIGEWCPNVFVSKYGMHRILETYDTLPPKKIYFLFTALFAVRSNFIPLQFCATHTVVTYKTCLTDEHAPALWYYSEATTNTVHPLFLQNVQTFPKLKYHFCSWMMENTNCAEAILNTSTPAACSRQHSDLNQTRK